ncbi:MAG TPA: hypothetical protein VLJ61_12250 [Pyrinomonadaceae bacterium]|nr:hypothetical protein [Pyrinomonadaceae bacterium]
MTKLLRALLTLAVAFVIGVSAAMLWVYYLPDEKLESEHPNLAKVKEDALIWWYQPHAFKVFVPEKIEQPKDLVCVIVGRSTLVISIDAERRLKLNDSDVGTLADTVKLKDSLREIFRWRVENRVWRTGVESQTDLPDNERIERTVFVQAAPSLKYGDVIKLIDEIKDTAANPIGLRIENSPPYAPLSYIPPYNFMHPTTR